MTQTVKGVVRELAIPATAACLVKQVKQVSARYYICMYRIGLETLLSFLQTLAALTWTVRNVALVLSREMTAVALNPLARINAACLPIQVRFRF